MRRHINEENSYVIMKKIINNMKCLIVYLLLSLFIIELYLNLSQFWVDDIGGGSSHVFKFEIPFVVSLAALLFFPKIKNKVIRHILPLIPIVVLYFLFDVFYSFLRRSPRPSDLQNIGTIADFSSTMAFGLFSCFLIIFLSVSILMYFAFQESSLKTFISTSLCRLLIVFIITGIFLSDGFAHYHNKWYEYGKSSQGGNVRKNGRFSSFIFYNNQEKLNRLALHKYRSQNIDIHNILYPGSVKNAQNIHMIVMESFIDPRLLNGLRFDKSPLATELYPYLIGMKKQFSHVISPVYGGDTAQAEFELLTGIKAFAKIDSIEFNVMTGHQTSSLVNRLKQNNYQTIATIASGSKYFNSTHAYKSLGFDHVSFLEEDKTFEKVPGDEKVFDGDLLQYNFKVVKNILANSSQPVFNYVLGIYGHTPYKRNVERRPNHIAIVDEYNDSSLRNISNQFYYRTKALAKYIEMLLAIDPNSFIYVTSDHLPPILNNEIHYGLDRHTNIAFFIKQNVAINVSGKKYFEIPWLIWDFLTQTDRNKTLHTMEIEKLYYKLLSESISSR